MPPYASGPKPTIVIAPPQGAKNGLGFGVSTGPPNAWGINAANDYGVGGGPGRGGGTPPSGTSFTPSGPPAGGNSMLFGQGFTGANQGQQIFQGFGADGKPIFGAAGGGVGGGLGNIGGLINQQMQQNNQARQQQQALWDELKKYMMGIPGQYTSDPRLKATQALTSRFLANPEALNDNVMAKIMNQTSNNITAQGDNAYRQQAGMLASQGESDASSLAAARARIAREGMAAQTGANTQLEIQRANQRNQDYMNALNQGRAQSQADIGVPMQVGNSLLANQPQFRADDLSGLGALAMAQQNQQAMLEAIRSGQGSQYQNPGDSAYNKVGGKGPYQDSSWQEQYASKYSQLPQSKQWWQV